MRPPLPPPVQQGATKRTNGRTTPAATPNYHPWHLPSSLLATASTTSTSTSTKTAQGLPPSVSVPADWVMCHVPWRAEELISKRLSCWCTMGNPCTASGLTRGLPVRTSNTKDPFHIHTHTSTLCALQHILYKWTEMYTSCTQTHAKLLYIHPYIHLYLHIYLYTYEM